MSGARGPRPKGGVGHARFWDFHLWIDPRTNIPQPSDPIIAIPDPCASCRLPPTEKMGCNGFFDTKVHT